MYGYYGFNFFIASIKDVFDSVYEVFCEVHDAALHLTVRVFNVLFEPLIFLKEIDNPASEREAADDCSHNPQWKM